MQIVAGSIVDRESTIRMTLTPSDLRIGTAEGEGYSHEPQYTAGAAQKADLLALEPLSVCDDPTGAHGAFAVHDDENLKGLRRVWKTLKRH